VSQKTPLRPRIVKIIKNKFDPLIAEVYPEMVFRHVLNIMSFIDNNEFIAGQKRHTSFLQDKIAKQQCVVGHNNISILQATPGGPVKAITKIQALATATIAVLALYPVPDSALRQKRQIA
jgi:hypothetical protein